ncbi:hypothetical protein MTR67_038024 [Solanum verrucosum]|uniref:Putative plant transposon protein domain-containing protein n=1 Tax=Solanum verrucosum TaxID=315347 RepID=A0AAF0UFZ8_SOLVR|nr:hypothetical protein MTR67_038024 [Solanum verrucosum]
MASSSSGNSVPAAEAVQVLVSSLADDSLIVREASMAALKEITFLNPLLVLDCCLTVSRGGRRRFGNIAGLFQVISVAIQALDKGDVDHNYLAKLAKIATSEVISTKELNADWQRAAAGVLVSIGSHMPDLHNRAAYGSTSGFLVIAGREHMMEEIFLHLSGSNSALPAMVQILADFASSDVYASPKGCIGTSGAHSWKCEGYPPANFCKWLRMDRIEGPDYPYERFLDVASHERWVLEFYAHLPRFPNPTIYIQGVDIHVDAQFVNLALRVLKVPHGPYKAKLRETDMTWLWNTLVEEKYWEEVNWFTTDSLTCHYYSPDTRRWLIFVGRRICPSDNVIDVTYPRAVVVACIITVISVNVGEQIVAERKDFYRGSKKSPFLHGLVSYYAGKQGFP